MLELAPTLKRELRARAHHLDPVVSIAGNGLSANVLKEIDQALKVHELIKIRVYGDDREVRAAYLEQICAELDCASVQSIGKLLVVYRPNPDLHLPPPIKTQPARSHKKKAGESSVGFNKRPGRPTTANAPRKAFAAAPEARYRKPTAGSGRARKSAR